MVVVELDSQGKEKKYYTRGDDAELLSMEQAGEERYYLCDGHGSIYDLVTLHKYLYANANPVKYTDPSGYMGLAVEQNIEMDCSLSLNVVQAYVDSVIFSIGIKAVCQIKAISVVTNLMKGDYK